VAHGQNEHYESMLMKNYPLEKKCLYGEIKKMLVEKQIYYTNLRNIASKNLLFMFILFCIQEVWMLFCFTIKSLAKNKKEIIQRNTLETNF